MIHIGDYWGRKYEYFRYYLPFRIRYGIRFVNPHHCMEAIRNPEMYTQPGFLPTIGNEVIFDIGSQFGDYALLWEKRYGAVVYAFELLENNYAEMLIDLKLNKSKIKPFNIAVGDGKNLSYTVRGDMAINEYSWNFTETVRLDDLVFGKFNVKPNILKIDVEGFELEVLKGARKSLKENSVRLIVETHSTQLRKQVDEFLSELNYYPKFVGRTVKGEGWKDEITNVFYLKKVD